jgi:23S rRNA (guanosine2251-2'-O)-methyltransferase
MSFLIRRLEFIRRVVYAVDRMRHLIILAHNIRSTHNVGSLLRTAEGLGVEVVILSGYTPYPLLENDERLPHIAQKINRQISKTALGAEVNQVWRHEPVIESVITELRNAGYIIAALEQANTSQALPDYQPPDKIALIVGREVEGIEQEILALCDTILEIPMFGHKESFNVVQAAAMALYHFRFTSS